MTFTGTPVLPLLNDSGLIEAEEFPVQMWQQYALPLLNDSGLIEAGPLVHAPQLTRMDLPLLNDSGLIEASSKRSFPSNSRSRLPLLNDSGLIEAARAFSSSVSSVAAFRC